MTLLILWPMLFILIGFLFGSTLYVHDEVYGNKGKESTRYRYEHYWHRMAGVVVGWLLVYILMERLGVLEGNFDPNNLGAQDLVIFLLAWIGVLGRLPVLAHGVLDWFKR